MAVATRTDDAAAASARKKVAVVGSGIAGLTAAYLLSQTHDVTILESEPAVGMDAHSRDLGGARMDIPLRVFSQAYYPNLVALYRKLGIRFGIADYSFGCVNPAASARAYFRFWNLLIAGKAIPLPSGVAARSIFKHARLCYQFVHFMNNAPTYLADPSATPLTLGEFLSAHGYSAEFARELLYPMVSIVCTCTWEAAEAYPAAVVVDYFANKCGISGAQCRAIDGTRGVVSKLTKPVSRVIVNARVISVRGEEGSGVGGGATVEFSLDGGRRIHHERYDEVILATQANTSLQLLGGTPAPSTGAAATTPTGSRGAAAATPARGAKPKSPERVSPTTRGRAGGPRTAPRTSKPPRPGACAAALRALASVRYERHRVLLHTVYAPPSDAYAMRRDAPTRLCRRVHARRAQCRCVPAPCRAAGRVAHARVAL